MAAKKPTAAQLRQACAADAPAMVAMLRQAAHDGMLGIDAGALDPEREALQLANLDLTCRCALAAATPEGPRGFVLAVRGAPPSLSHTAVVSLVVDHAHRRQGLGLLLLEGVAAWARAAGVDKLSASVYGRNTAAQGLFTRAGYTLEGVRRRQLRLGAALDDEWWYGRWPAEGGGRRDG